MPLLCCGGHRFALPLPNALARYAMPLSRMPTMALTIGFTVIPFFFSRAWILVLLPAYPSLFEGVVHVAGAKLCSSRSLARRAWSPPLRNSSSARRVWPT